LGALPRGLGALRRWDARLGRLVDGLADAVVAGRLAAGLAGEARALAAERPAAALGAQSVRLPSCFRGFDQHPDDLARLVDRLRALTGAGPAPVAVVGLRTSGSYLAPLAAALLRARGAPAVALTLRPWHPLPAPKRRALRAVSEAGGLVAVTDDPPSSGASLARAAAAIERLAPRRVVLMLALFDPALPPALARWPAVVLPWGEWSVHERLEPGSVAATLERLWPGARVRSVRRLPLADRPGRGYCAGRYRVAIGGRAPEDVLVRGAGLGYFCAAALRAHVRRRRGDGARHLVRRAAQGQDRRARVLEPQPRLLRRRLRRRRGGGVGAARRRRAAPRLRRRDGRVDRRRALARLPA